MDGSRFDSLTRALVTCLSRRRLTGLLAALPLVVPAASRDEDDADAAAKRKRGGRRGGKKRKAPGGATPPISLPPSPLPPPPPSCPQSAAPHYCASMNVCVPDCAADQYFDAATCRCLCTSPRTCCRCTHQSNGAFLCYENVASAPECESRCQNDGGGNATFLAEAGSAVECHSQAETCRFTCSSGRICGTANFCQNPLASCDPDASCYQPLGGGPTRCVILSTCGCASHQQCVDELAMPGAMCIDLTGCQPCDGFNTACAVPMTETFV